MHQVLRDETFVNNIDMYIKAYLLKHDQFDYPEDLTSQALSRVRL